LLAKLKIAGCILLAAYYVLKSFFV